MKPRAKCILILSEKSSGSSALQNLLTRFADLRYLRQTRHYEHETLYWVKAASVLGYPQIKMIDSEVPIPPDRARSDLQTLLLDNLERPVLPNTDQGLVFDGWRQLCEAYRPVFVEKSPHHLCQWSALELIVEARDRLKDVDFFVVGLIRNPMDTLYSQFQRWRSPPERLQYRWGLAYRNLLKFKEIFGQNLLVLRYEDMVSSARSLQPVLNFCGSALGEDEEGFFHNRSVAKYRADRYFGFRLADEIVELAKIYGYGEDDLRNDPWMFWPVYRHASRVGYKAFEFVSNGASALSRKRQ